MNYFYGFPTNLRPIMRDELCDCGHICVFLCINLISYGPCEVSICANEKNIVPIYWILENSLLAVS